MPAHPVSRLVRFALAVGTTWSSTTSAIGGLQSTPCAMVEAVELVACHVFHLADRDDRSVSMEDGAHSTYSCQVTTTGG